MCNSNIKLNEIDLLTFIFGLLGHDIKHPGLTKSTKNIEYFHYVETNKILSQYQIKFNSKFLKQIILATDTSNYTFNKDFESIAYLVKLADINHSVSDLKNHLLWTDKLKNELNVKFTPKEQILFLENYVFKILEKNKPNFNKTYFKQLELNFKMNISFWKKKLPKR